MEIRPKTNVDSVPRVYNPPGKASRTVDSNVDVSTFDSSRALEDQLNSLPDVRPDVVQRGKHLVGDPAYPPRETIQRISALLALANSDPSPEE